MPSPRIRPGTVSTGQTSKPDADLFDQRSINFNLCSTPRNLSTLNHQPSTGFRGSDQLRSAVNNSSRCCNRPTMVAFIQSSDFLNTLEHCAHKLNDDFDWDFFPKRYRSDEGGDVTNRWGRIAIEFATPDWRPTITVGFLVDERDHEVEFVNPRKGIDLLLRIEAHPGDQENIAAALAELDGKRKKLSNLAASALLPPSSAAIHRSTRPACAIGLTSVWFIISSPRPLPSSNRYRATALAR